MSKIKSSNPYYVVGSEEKPFDEVKASPMKKMQIKMHVRNQLDRNNEEVASSFSNGSGDKMDESTKMMIERLERDSREREERYHNDAREREQRLEKRFERIETLLSSSRQEMREDIADLKSDMKSDVAEIKTDFREMKQDFKDLKKSTDDTNKWIIGLAITTIAAIVAVAVSVWVK